MDNQEDVVETERQRKYESSKETEPADRYLSSTDCDLFTKQLKQLKEIRKDLIAIVNKIGDIIDESEQQNLFEADEE